MAAAESANATTTLCDYSARQTPCSQQGELRCAHRPYRRRGYGAVEFPGSGGQGYVGQAMLWRLLSRSTRPHHWQTSGRTLWRVGRGLFHVRGPAVPWQAKAACDAGHGIGAKAPRSLSRLNASRQPDNWRILERVEVESGRGRRNRERSAARQGTVARLVRSRPISRRPISHERWRQRTFMPLCAPLCRPCL